MLLVELAVQDMIFTLLDRLSVFSLSAAWDRFGLSSSESELEMAAIHLQTIALSLWCIRTLEEAVDTRRGNELDRRRTLHYLSLHGASCPSAHYFSSA